MKAMARDRRLAIFLAAFLAFVATSTGHAQTFNVSFPQIPLVPGAGGAAPPPVQPAASSPSGPCVLPASQPAPIAALVVALKCDPDLMFEYVYNNIEFEPLYGSIKGPLGTLLDRRGGDGDQAMLLYTLLDAAGYTPQIAWAVIRLTGAQLSKWLGVPNDATALENLLNAGFISTLNPTANPDGTLNFIDLGHFAVSLTLNGTAYVFDPSFKQHTITSGLPNLASVLGYNRTQFLTDAGGTIDSVSISNVNRAALRADLTAYANNLVNYINQNNRTWSVGNIIGGKSIVPLSGSPIRQTSFPNLSPAFPSSEMTFPTFPAACPMETPPASQCRTFLTITIPGGSTITLYTDQTYGHRVTVFSVPSGSQFVPTLLIDGAPPSCVATGCINTGTPANAGATLSFPVQVVQSNQNLNQSTPCGTGITACKMLTIAAGASYLISMGAGQVGRGMPEYHRQLLAQARAAGNADTSELVLGESLAVISYNWLAECSAEQQVADRLAAATTLYYFGVGITGQANIQQTNFQGPYVDLPINNLGITPQVSNGPTTTIDGQTYATALVAAGFTYAVANSSFESGVLEQTQAPVSGMTAASTIKIIDSNMTPGFPGALQKTYFADGTTSSGQSTYTGSICPSLQNHYSTADLGALSSAVFGQNPSSTNVCAPASSFTSGQMVLAPENGQLAIGQWSGAGYTSILPQMNTVTITQKISGGMSGGFSGTNVPDFSLTDNTQVTLSPAAVTDTLTQILNSIPGLADPKASEPVDSVTGAYIYKHDDLTTGGGNFPYALPFARTYLSSSGTFLTNTGADIGTGNGWAHTYSANAQVQSDPYIGLGPANTLAVSAATSIAALYVMQDLLSVTPTPQTMTVSSMVTRWFTDQLNGNAVMVQQPDTTEEFVALPHADGSTAFGYNPPPGSSVQFNQIAAGQYTYARKDGVELNFGPTPAGALQRWSFPNGMSVNLTYSSSGQLQRVANNVGRSLTLSYGGTGTGTDIASVTDDSGRKTAYAYDANHNLVAFTDPVGATTTYAYDSTGTYDTFGHLTQVIYPFMPGNAFVTNWYDPLGRVIKQANANGFASNFYLAGSRTELIDALGNRHVSYQTDRGKVIKDAFVLSAGFGDVFNDTAQQNGVVNVTANQYDGLDRLTLTTLPEGGTTAVTYATAINPWANNVASITRTAKPGSPLAPLTSSFQYDPLWNKPMQAIDPLGLVTTQSFDPTTGNLIASVADSGGAGHFNATTRMTYDAHGRVRSTTDPLGVVTTFAYDSFENLVVQVADAGGSGHLNSTTISTYDSVGDATARTDPNGNIATMGYDADRRVIITTAPPPFDGSGVAPVRTSNTYDPDGHLIAVARANGGSAAVTRMSYTATGEVQTATDANGNVTTNAYDADDRLQRVTDPLLRVTAYAYDAMGRRIGVYNPAIQGAPLLQQSYTPDGLVASLTDANNNTTTFSPDGFDRLSTTTYPDSSTEVLTYDADGNVLSGQTRAGATIAFTYDTLNRLSGKTAPGEAPVSYAYNLASRLIGASDTSAAMAAPAASASFSTSLAYDALNRPMAVNWSPAPSQTTPSPATATFAFAYDATNRRVGQSATDNSWWSYPAAATNVSYTANNLNQYTAVGVATPTYDGNGNLTFDGTFTYCYDAENRLLSILSGGTCASPTTTLASYAYDAQGRRKSKTVGSTTTIYVTDTDNREVLEYDGTSGALGNWYSFAPASAFGPDAVLNQMSVANSTRGTLIADVQGSIIGALDATGGSLIKTGYQTYGENPGLTSGSYQYTARRFDPETAGSTSQPSGLYYYRARMYSPGWGRFIQVDTVGYSRGGNLYAYVENDPLNNADPMGLWVVQIGYGWSANGFLAGGAESGVAFGTGGFATYSTTSIGTGVGEEVSSGFHLTFAPSASASVANLSGSATNLAISGGEGVVAGVDITTAPSGEMAYGLSLGGGGGSALGLAETFQFTTSTCWTCPTQSNLANAAQSSPNQNTVSASAPNEISNSVTPNSPVSTSGPALTK